MTSSTWQLDVTAGPHATLLALSKKPHGRRLYDDPQFPAKPSTREGGSGGTSLGVQWLRIRLPVQQTKV